MTHVNQPMVSRKAAVSAIDAAIAEAEAIGVAVVVSVVDAAGIPVAMQRMDGSPLLSIDIAADKAWTVASFGQPTTWWAEMIAADASLAALGNNNRLMPVPGGVPLLTGDALMGAIGVSGATAEQDHQIASAGAAAIADQG